jgi:hypothetical protein
MHIVHGGHDVVGFLLEEGVECRGGRGQAGVIGPRVRGLAVPTTMGDEEDEAARDVKLRLIGAIARLGFGAVGEDDGGEWPRTVRSVQETVERE